MHILEFINSFKAPISLIPVTVLVAFILFFTKEFLEWRRRAKADKRKMIALRALLAIECERNNWVIRNLRGIINEIRCDFEEELNYSYSITFPKNGNVLFTAYDSDGQFDRSSTLAKVHRDVFDKNLLDIAILNKKLFEAVLPAWEGIGELEHVRKGFIYYIAPDRKDDEDMLQGFVEYALEELDRIFVDLQNLYLECTGKSLENVRRR